MPSATEVAIFVEGSLLDDVWRLVLAAVRMNSMTFDYARLGRT
jgi:hypothetical protein